MKKSISFLALFPLLMLVVSCSKPNPRKSGIGFRLGYTLNNSEFRNDNASFVRSDISVNGDIGERFPLFYQSDEELINNYAYSLLHNSKIKSSLRKKKIKIKLPL